MNFYDRPDCLNPSPYIDEYGTKSGIFIFKNFIKKEYIEKIESEIKKLDKKNIHYKDTLIDWYSEKVTPYIPGIHDVWEQISELLYPNWVIHPMNNLLSIGPEHDGMFIHADSPGKGACHLLSQTDTWQTCCELDYGIVAYFGDFESGQIFYPKINKDGSVKPDNLYSNEDCFEYTPEKGDLVIHSAFSPYNHGVRPITSGRRYAFACFSLKAKDNPGSFYNYKTSEYYKQVGNKTQEELRKWNIPLKENPQFTQEKIKEIQMSGLKGEDLAKEFFSDMA
jgi:hypothetical protein